MAVDLGSSNTTIWVRGRGVALAEPSLLAVQHPEGRTVAIGADAKQMLGRAPARIQMVRPVRGGVIADLEQCERMLRYFVQRVHQRRWAQPKMVVCVPTGTTGVEQRAVTEAAESAGARRPVQLIEEPVAAALGVGLPVNAPTGSMVVVCGGGRTEVAVIALGGIVAHTSVPQGGDALDEAVMAYARKEYSLALGERTAEEIKVLMGTAYPPEAEFEAEISGRDLVTGLPRTVVASTAEIREAIEEPVAAVVDAVKATLDVTPPDLAADIMATGIALAGGGALLHGLDQRLADETGMPITITGNPLQSVVRGAGRCLDEPEASRRLFVRGTAA
ncbi:MAG: rod shape-determining protein [Acidimicrobiia bacterium]